MTDNRTIPLHIFEVLEQEFTALHGTPYDEVTIKLPDSHDSGSAHDVVAHRTWAFHESHIADLAGLVNMMRPRFIDNDSASDHKFDVSPDRWARKELRIFVWSQFSEDTKKAFLNLEEYPRPAQLVTTELNKLLENK